ncbi:hypothetical protein OGZ37_06875 [Lactococcus lactis]|uniref:hypothetical protein n=1 Tax=Lactococcus lactis TaxID=1358 RepID=UPI0024185A93|nr:hypothetical protein [Lactococcus lactis]MDG4966299.1 hypothetical protein [Lactococcus lactis]
MNKDYLTSPFNDESFKSSFTSMLKTADTTELNRVNTAPLGSIQSIIKNMKSVNKTIDYTKLTANPKSIFNISNSADLKSIGSILKSENFNPTSSIAAIYHKNSAVTDYMRVINNISNAYSSVRENQKICSEKSEINSTINTCSEKNYNSKVKENDDVETLGVLLEKFITSYQSIKQMSSHTYTLASENKIALTVYANSFTLLVEYIASITSPVLISLSLSIITTVIINFTDANKS